MSIVHTHDKINEEERRLLAQVTILEHWRKVGVPVPPPEPQSLRRADPRDPDGLLADDAGEGEV